MANALVLVETEAGAAKKTSLGGISFAQQYCAKTGGKVHLLVVGSGADKIATSLTSYGDVYAGVHSALDNPVAESLTTVIVQARQACSASLVAASATSVTKDCLPRVAARLRAPMATDVLALVDERTFRRPMWAGNVIATVALAGDLRVCSVRATEFAAPQGGATGTVTALPVDLQQTRAQFVSVKKVKSSRPDATIADVVVSGGRGVKGPEGFKLIEQLADQLGAGIGASRAVCDAGWVPNDLQIGQTGKVVAPNLYFAIGISGAIQHIAGMKGSKTIVAINKDPDAPIFQVADYGLVADLFVAVPELLTAIQAG
jgi:electron transfer flavoprotein alpha subunit